MAAFWCLNSKCKKMRMQVQSAEEEPLCATCYAPLVAIDADADPGLLEASGRVEKELGNGWAASYQKRVIDDLFKRPPYFKLDFIDEMSKPTEFGKFVGTQPRPTDAGKVCVDNALKAVNYAFPTTLPRGEKFDFELPYIMDDAGFTAMNDATDIFKTSFKELAGIVAANRLYLVVAKKLGQAVGHMVVITTDGSKNAFLTDLQKLAFGYGLYAFIGWSSGTAPASRPKPYRPVDLSTGTLSGNWVN